MAQKVEIEHEVWDLEGGGRRVYLVIETSDFGIKSDKLPSRDLAPTDSHVPHAQRYISVSDVLSAP